MTPQLEKLEKHRTSTKECLSAILKYSSGVSEITDTSIKDLVIIKKMIDFLEQELAFTEETIKNYPQLKGIYEVYLDMRRTQKKEVYKDLFDLQEKGDK